MSGREALAGWLLRRVIGECEAEVVLGDLEEGWSARAAGGTGRRLVTWWYWMEVASCLRPATARAMRYRDYGGRKGTGGFMRAFLSDLRYAVRTLGVRPRLGRGFADDEIRQQRRVAVLSYRV